MYLAGSVRRWGRPSCRALSSLFFASAVLAVSLIFQGEQLHWLACACLLMLVWTGALLWRVYLPGISLRFSPIALFISVFWSWLALSLAWNPVAVTGLVYFAWLSVFPAAFWLYVLSATDDRSRAGVAMAVYLAGFALSVWAFGQWVLGLSTPRSVFLDVNSHAAFLGLVAMPLAARFMSDIDGRFRWLGGAMLFVLVIAITIAGSRGVMMSAAVALSLLFWMAWKHAPRRSMWQMIAIICVALVIGNVMVGGQTTSRLASLEDPVAAGSDRLMIWQAAWAIVRASPWIGHGLGSFPLLYPAWRNPADSSSGHMVHNDYLQLWLETGLPAVVLLFLLYLAIAWRFFRAQGSPTQRVEAAGLFSGLSLVALHSFVNFNFYLAATLLVCGLWLGRLHQLIVPEGSVRTLRIEPARFVRRGVYRLLIMLVLAIPTAWLVAIGSAYLFYQQGQSLASKGRFLAAHESFLLAERLFPEMHVIYFTHADLYRHMLRATPADRRSDRELLFRAAEESLDTSQRLNPYQPQTHWVRGDLYVDAPDLTGPDWPRRAEAEYRKAIALNPRFFAAREHYARLLIRQGLLRDAHAVLEAGLREYYPEHPALVSYLTLAAEARERRGDRVGAGKLREQVARIRAAQRHRVRSPGPVVVLPVPVSAELKGK